MLQLLGLLIALYIKIVKYDGTEIQMNVLWFILAIKQVVELGFGIRKH